LTLRLATRGRASSAAALALAAAGSLLACRSAPRVGELSVVLVTLDTTRADRIGAFGGTAVPTPNLDRLAREGTIARDASSQVPLTLPSHATIMTGRYPASHGVRHNGIYRLRAEEETLAEHLKAAGFETAAFVGSYVLNRGFGIEQGFDRYDDVPVDRFAGGRDQVFEAQRTADEVNAQVFRYLDARRGGRLFLWVHYYDPHEPYAPPERPGRTLAGSGYDREISYVDACVGDLVAKLEERGILDRALLIVAGDHGESLGEHGEKTHGLLLYQGALHVPLILRAPGLVPRGGAFGGPAELADIAPTIVDYLRLPPLAHAQGTSLKPRVEGRDDGRTAVAHAETMMPRLEFGWSDLAMVRDGRFKFIRAPRSELYDLASDPSEGHDLAAQESDRAAEMSGQLSAWASATEDAAAGRASARKLDPDEEARLRSLGYLGGDAFKTAAGGTGTAIDPKDGIAEVRALDAARAKLDAGDAAGALEDLAPILRQNPRNHQARVTKILALIKLPDLPGAEGEAMAALAAAESGDPGATVVVDKARGLLASVYRLEGKALEAEAEYRRILRADPDNEPVAVDLARLLVETRRLPEAGSILDGVLAKDARNGMALAARFQLASARGDDALRLDVARALADARAGDPPTLLEAGRLLMDAHEPARAAACFAVVVEMSDHPDPELLGKLGFARLAAGDLDGAAEAFRASSALLPGDPRAVYFLGVVAQKRGDPAAARREFERALTIDPGFSKAADALDRLGGRAAPPRP
jgi:arylsulfatase A-like enzyme/thioredoxin-like negative regulator of GroEL